MEIPWWLVLATVVMCLVSLAWVLGFLYILIKPKIEMRRAFPPEKPEKPPVPPGYRKPTRWSGRTKSDWRRRHGG